MKVAELSYKPKQGGLSSGTLMLYLQVEGESSPSPDFEVIDIVERCEQATFLFAMKIRNILIKPSKEADEKQILQLLILLRDRGFTVALLLEGYHVPIYLHEANFVQAIVTTPKWSNFKVNELLYIPRDNNLIEPEIAQNNTLCQKYLLIPKEKKVNIKPYLQFIKEAKFPWGLIIPFLKDISINLLGE